MIDDLPTDPDASAADAAAADDHGLALLHSRWDVLLAISAGGALGSLGRWGVGELLPWSGTTYPWATFVENVSGGLALGALMVVVLAARTPHRYLRPFLGVGLLGGYTTFSTYMLDTRQLLATGHVATAFLYLAGSLLAGLGAVWLGIATARRAVQAHRARDPWGERS